MREIKFELRYDNGLPNKIVTLAELANGLDKENGEHLFVTARQYTGLKDKNGVEIYEGDVIQWQDSYGVPELGNDRFYVKHEVIFRGGAFEPACQIPKEEIEVIGNIYQNPELLQ